MGRSVQVCKSRTNRETEGIVKLLHIRGQFGIALKQRIWPNVIKFTQEATMLMFTIHLPIYVGRGQRLAAVCCGQSAVCSTYALYVLDANNMRHAEYQLNRT